ncbi:hypothetical protein TPB0596_21100 [Tsukamurella pulmonis]|uniref:Rv1893 family protein n=1 Tax=Tsukamurella pulmonis TaxID=47312 RepID=UPI00079AABD8|nr:hypothetical protein [Tsukamurella pulmonis]KXP10512.1 hypothetical protein AXK57_09190 [Tsukamurella pulmonis]BDD82347.1 hypothetical protein TPB0596_21100 [Tsukamurella pulmonis]
MIGKRIQENIEAVTRIAADSVRKSGEIVEGAGEALGGDVKGGVGRMAASAADIATSATTEGVKLAGENLAAAREASDAVADKVTRKD